MSCFGKGITHVEKRKEPQFRGGERKEGGGGKFHRSSKRCRVFLIEKGGRKITSVDENGEEVDSCPGFLAGV